MFIYIPIHSIPDRDPFPSQAQLHYSKKNAALFMSAVGLHDAAQELEIQAFGARVSHTSRIDGTLYYIYAHILAKILD